MGQGHDGMSLHEACYQGCLDVVAQLLANGADPNEPADPATREWISCAGDRPRPLNCVAIAWTLTENHVAIARLLIEHGGVVDHSVLSDHEIEMAGLGTADLALRSLLEKAHNDPQPTRPGPAVRHLSGSESPFEIEVWDCSAFTQSMVSTTADPRIAASFAALRSSAGTEYQGQGVADGRPTACALQYLHAGAVQDGALFKADRMEDKWDIYLYRPHLYFARSWTGQLTYRAEVLQESNTLRVTAIESGANENAEFARRVVDYLIRSHLLGLRVPHPLPADLPPQPEKIAALSFSLFGRRCLYGSYADTSRVAPKAPGQDPLDTLAE